MVEVTDVFREIDMKQKGKKKIRSQNIKNLNLLKTLHYIDICDLAWIKCYLKCL